MMKKSNLEDPLPETETAAEAPNQKGLSQQEKRPQSLWIRWLRWILGLLVVFGLGALLVIFTLFLPLRRELNARDNNLQSSDEKIAELESRIQNLTPLDQENQDLETQLKQSQLHIALLNARVDVTAAQLALANNDPSKARVAISKTPETLNRLASLLAPNQRQVVMDMQARLKLANGEIESNTYAAQSDLDVLATSLLELENAVIR